MGLTERGNVCVKAAVGPGRPAASASLRVPRSMRLPGSIEANESVLAPLAKAATIDLCFTLSVLLVSNQYAWLPPSTGNQRPNATARC
jgi:hypothetical protein